MPASFHNFYIVGLLMLSILVTSTLITMICVKAEAINFSRGFHGVKLRLIHVQSSREFISTTFNSINVGLSYVESSRTWISTSMSSSLLKLVYVYPRRSFTPLSTFGEQLVSLLWVAPASGVATRLTTSFQSSTYPLSFVEPAPRNVGSYVVSTFNSVRIQLSRVLPRQGNVVTTFNIERIQLHNEVIPKIEKLEVLGYGAPRNLLAGYNYSIVAEVSSSSKIVEIVMESNESLLISVYVDVSKRSYSVEGALAKYVRSIEIGSGSVIINVSLHMPWNRSLQGAAVLRVKATNLWGVATYSINTSILQSLSIANASYPSIVAPGQRFNVTLQFVYNNTNLIPPPRTPISINGSIYRTDPRGRIVVSLRAPTTPGSYKITLSTMDPANNTIPVNISIKVVQRTTTSSATSITTTTIAQLTATTSSITTSSRITQLRTTWSGRSGASGNTLGGTAWSIALSIFVLLVMASVLTFVSKKWVNTSNRSVKATTP